MASNVFGTPVTNESLEGLPEYHDKKPTQKDRARVALEMKNGEGKDMNARRFVETLLQRHPEGKHAAMCLIYNATGNPLLLFNHHYWNGCLGESPMPSRIENGQWGAFLFVDAGQDKAKGGVIYTGRSSCDDPSYSRWALCWETTSSQDSSNHVCTDIEKYLDFDAEGTAHLDKKLSDSAYLNESRKGDLLMYSCIGNTPHSIVEGICTIYDVWYS